MLSPATEFQSALPLRGATGAYTGNFRNAMEFQSALPLRGATRDCRTALIGPGRISIRAPLAGSDGRPDGRPGFYVISIRAPLAGSDTRAYSLRYTHRHFNPRSPCGERLRPNCRWSWNLYFNPRSPCGERPRGPARDRRRHISIRAPLAGSDEGAVSSRGAFKHFNPRSPCGERPLHFVASIYYQQSVVFSKTVTANSVDKLRKTTAKSAITRCEPHS